MHAPRRDDGRPIRLEPEDVGWARIFYGLDPDGYEVMFKRFLG
jgi:lactoylglutathione lyase